MGESLDSLLFYIHKGNNMKKTTINKILLVTAVCFIVFVALFNYNKTETVPETTVEERSVVVGE
jgi:hypothetical protein